MYWDVVQVKSVAPRELQVQFADGLSGVVRIDSSFCTGVFSPLLNDQVVSAAHVSDGVVVWPTGLDLAPDTMYQEIKRSPDRRYHLCRSQRPEHPQSELRMLQAWIAIHEEDLMADWALAGKGEPVFKIEPLR